MTPQETIDRLFSDVERQTGHKLEYPMDLSEAITVLTIAGYWCEPQVLQFAAQKGVIRLPVECSHVSEMMLSERQVKALGAFLEKTQQWSPLGVMHDCKRERADLDDIRRLRRELIAIEGQAKQLGPIELLDILHGEKKPNRRWMLWLTMRNILSRLERQRMAHSAEG